MLSINDIFMELPYILEIVSVILHHSLIHNLLDIFDKGNKVFLEMFL